MTKKALDKWQFGDFQTPSELATEVARVLKENHAVQPDVVFECSCGTGSFVTAALRAFPDAHVWGYDVNPHYVQEANAAVADDDKHRAAINEGDFFAIDWGSVLARAEGRLLILGNPPWVTSSELGMLNSQNLPEKSNFQSRRGIEAITGSGNFDISEWMLLQHVEWLSNRDGTIAMLCKYSVARKVMRQVRRSQDHRFFGHIYSVDAKRHFSAAVEACLFVLTTEPGNADCEVYTDLASRTPAYVIGERDGYVVRDVQTYERWRHLRGHGAAEYTWRSGVKHDSSKIMELEPIAHGFRNGLQEHVELENQFIYPLLKSSDVGNSRTKSCRRFVLVTQKAVGDDTSIIQTVAPNTWAYLESHADALNARRSSIYRGKPRYSIFGVGEYTFRPWKIAISALYKRLNFCLIGPIAGKPVVFDDTVNFLSFASEREAEFIYRLVTSQPALEFYEALIFWDEKRPITTDILRRLCLKAVAQELGCEQEYSRLIEDSASTRISQRELAIPDSISA